MTTTKQKGRIIGFWKGAIRALIVCPYCSRFISRMRIEKFRKLLERRNKFKNIKLDCSYCKMKGFVYLEQPWETIWKVMERGRMLMRFDGWRKRSFLMNAAELYSRDSAAYLNILRLREFGFRCYGRGRGDLC